LIMKKALFLLLIMLLLSSCGAKDGESASKEGGAFYPEETSMVLPWEDGGKSPEEYTWAEFEALNPVLQIKFQSAFEEEDGFEKWMESATEEKLEMPWENGGKRPEEYTWAEFEALSPALQIQFQTAFEEQDGFDKWFERVKE